MNANGIVMKAANTRTMIVAALVIVPDVIAMPLATAAGGWGQLPAWKNKDDPEFRKMAGLVEKCIIRHPNENDNGWRPTLAQGGGIDWVIKDRENYSRRLRK